jgi:hypothetical protein
VTYITSDESALNLLCVSAYRNDRTVLRPDDILQILKCFLDLELCLGNIYRLRLRHA